MAEEKKATAEEKETPKKSQRQLEIEELRKNRVPAGIPGMNLDFPTREGYVRRVVKDIPGRLEKFLKGGWRFVKKDDLGTEDKNVTGLLKASTREGLDSRVSQVIGTNKDRSPATGYLMEIPEELYQEDQSAKMEKVNELEAGLRRGHDADGQASDGRYIPSQGIKIEQKGGKR